MRAATGSRSCSDHDRSGPTRLDAHEKYPVTRENRGGSPGNRTLNLRIKSPLLCLIELATRRGSLSSGCPVVTGPVFRWMWAVGRPTGFEPATSWTTTRCSNHAELRSPWLSTRLSGQRRALPANSGEPQRRRPLLPTLVVCGYQTPTIDRTSDRGGHTEAKGVALSACRALDTNNPPHLRSSRDPPIRHEVSPTSRVASQGPGGTGSRG